MNAIGVAEIAEPQGGQIAEIAQAALSGEDGEFELVFVEVGFSGDFEGAAVVFGAADDDEGAVYGLVLRFDAKHREFILKDFDCALPPVGEDAHSSFELEIDGVRYAAVGASAGDAEKVASFFGFVDGSREAEGNFADGSADEALGGLGDVPGEGEFFGEDVCRTAREKGERNAMTILLVREAIYDFVEGAVAAACDDELAAVFAGAHSDVGGVARAGRFGEVGLNAALGENSAGFVEFLATIVATASGVGVVNQESVA